VRDDVNDAEDMPASEADNRPTIAFSERLHIDVQKICELFDGGVEVDGDAVLAAGPKWIIYGRTTYDGEMILAEYDDPDEAEAVIRSLPERVTRSRR
jgi:hypothetical protein